MSLMAYATTKTSLKFMSNERVTIDLELYFYPFYFICAFGMWLSVLAIIFWFIKELSQTKNKLGSTGNLTFLKIKHEITNKKEILVNEIQNHVYREDKKFQKTKSSIGVKAPNNFHYEKSWETSPEMLFRYSALTHNTHKIHYDFPYATGVEGYPQIVVHGPLMATFLLDLISNIITNKQKLIKFTFRLKSPVFVGGTIFAQAIKTKNGLDLWIKDQNGYQSLTAEAVIIN